MYLYRKATLVVCAAIALTGMAQELAAQSGILTLEDAVNLALEHNRSIQQAALSASGVDDALKAARTQRLPQFKFSSTAGVMLTRPTITFDRGAFGDYPGIGPIPDNNVSIASPRKLTAVLSSEINVPITQQIKIRLNLNQLDVRKKSAGQQVRLTRQQVIKQVRQTYYSIVQGQSAMHAVEQTLALLRELDSETGHYVKVGTALESDLLNIRARLAETEYEKVSIAGPLTTQKEQLNQLLGRPVDTGFEVAAAVEANWIPALAEAREKAIASRPEIEQARLKVQDTDLDRRKKKSEYIPDVGFSVSYYSTINVAGTLPRNVAIAGFGASWEPFDWGRKRNELAQKQKSTREAEVALRDIEDKIRIEVGSAYRKMQEARVMLTASRAGQQSTREAARVASVRFRVNSALLKDVLSAQADIASANDRTQKALAAYWSARAELEAAMGEEQ
jgi:outer membrane protein